MILAILQARVSSSRLPGKVLKPILGVPMFLRQIERLQRSELIDQFMVATSLEPSDDPIENACRANGTRVFRGSLEDVLDRFYRAASVYRPLQVVRLTGDCPLADPELIDRLITFHLEGGFDYSSNCLEPTFPDGLDAEIFRLESLEIAWREAGRSSEREHVTPYFYGHPEKFKIGSLKQSPDRSFLRWTVDEPADFELVTRVYEGLYPANPRFSTADILAWLEQNPEMKTSNTFHRRNEGYLTMSLRYGGSEEMLERALKVIPLGSQTFSKSRTQYPYGVSPYFAARGQGSRLFDVDGNEYIDFVNSLAAVTLGYGDPDVSAAVRAQFDSGVIFSLPHPLEVQVAEKLVEMVPCAEMVRFGKNGSDVTSGAVRLARAFTGRDRIAVCGYHGWQDWYIGSTARHQGVPRATRELTHHFTYNDLDSLNLIFQRYPDQVAAVVMEPMNVVEPLDGFLAEVKELTRKHEALLVFDEIITGFRFANGGAQEYFGVVPDLATFGKGLANGYPVSAVAGREEIMRLMEEIFFSFTFGGETLSLAAALATMTKLQNQPVIETIRRQGQKVLDGVAKLIRRHDIGGILSVSGNPVWTFLLFADSGPYTPWQIKTLFMQEVFARGILTIGSHNLSYAHSDLDIERLLTVYDEVFAILGQAVNHLTLEKQLRCQPLEPLFKIR